MKQNVLKPGSFADSRKRTKDNILWLFIVVVLIAVAASSCSSERKGCQMRAGFIGYGPR